MSIAGGAVLAGAELGSDIALSVKEFDEASDTKDLVYAGSVGAKFSDLTIGTADAEVTMAVDTRNNIRQHARNCMINREWAEQLQLVEKNKTWEDLIKLRKKKYNNDMQKVYQSIIDSSQTSRQVVDNMYGL